LHSLWFGYTMKRSSPTPTTFSGISNYRITTHRAQAPIDYRSVSRIHHSELSRYLADYLAKGPALSVSASHTY